MRYKTKGRLLLSNLAQLYYNTFLSIFAIIIVTTDTSTTYHCCLVQGVYVKKAFNSKKIFEIIA